MSAGQTRAKRKTQLIVMSEGDLLMRHFFSACWGGGGGYRQENKIDTSPDNRSGGVFFKLFSLACSVLFNLILLHGERLRRAKSKAQRKEDPF